MHKRSLQFRPEFVRIIMIRRMIKSYPFFLPVVMAVCVEHVLSPTRERRLALPVQVL